MLAIALAHDRKYSTALRSNLGGRHEYTYAIKPLCISHAHRLRAFEVCATVLHGPTIETSSASAAPIARLAVGRRAYCDWRHRSASGGRKLLRPTCVAGAHRHNGANLHIDTRVEGRSCAVPTPRRL